MKIKSFFMLGLVFILVLLSVSCGDEKKNGVDEDVVSDSELSDETADELSDETTDSQQVEVTDESADETTNELEDETEDEILDEVSDETVDEKADEESDQSQDENVTDNDLTDESQIDEDVVPPVCDIPQTVVMNQVHKGAELVFTTASDKTIEVGIADNQNAEKPSSWTEKSSLTLDKKGTFKVFARLKEAGCEEYLFSHVYEVVESYPPKAGDPGSFAIGAGSKSIIAWSSGFVTPVDYGEDVDENWKTPENGTGTAEGTSTDIVCLGRGGSIVLTFDKTIKDGEGSDFAVFENSFNDTFLELGFVEVSSDGTNFIRFDTVYLGTTPVGAFGSHSPELFNGFAGAYRQGQGTPFDLSELKNRNEVKEGIVDLSAISHVKIVDVVGDGSMKDSFGNPVYDPYKTTGSAGFDLDSVAVINSN